MACAWAWITRAVTAAAVTRCWEAVWQVGELAKTRSAVRWGGSGLILVSHMIQAETSICAPGVALGPSSAPRTSSP